MHKHHMCHSACSTMHTAYDFACSCCSCTQHARLASQLAQQVKRHARSLRLERHAWRQASANCNHPKLHACMRVPQKRSWGVGVDHGKQSEASFRVEHVLWDETVGGPIKPFQIYVRHHAVLKSFRAGARARSSKYLEKCETTFKYCFVQHIYGLQLMTPLKLYHIWSLGTRHCHVQTMPWADLAPFCRQICSQKTWKSSEHIQPSLLVTHVFGRTFLFRHTSFERWTIITLVVKQQTIPIMKQTLMEGWSFHQTTCKSVKARYHTDESTEMLKIQARCLHSNDLASILDKSYNHFQTGFGKLTTKELEITGWIFRSFFFTYGHKNSACCRNPSCGELQITTSQILSFLCVL